MNPADPHYGPQYGPQYGQEAAVRAATDPSLSSWVEANAGSGKTKLLIDRLVRLLLSNAKPQEILCLTYTRIAAAHMTERLHEKLALWLKAPAEELEKELIDLLGPDVGRRQRSRAAFAGKARELFAGVLDTPSGMKIQTIHSFCESLLRRFPIEASVSPHFSTIDDSQARHIHHRILDRLADDAQSGKQPALAEALPRLSLLLDEEDWRQQILDYAKHWRKLAFFNTPFLPPPQALGISKSAKALLEDYCRNETPIDAACLRALDHGGKTDRDRKEKIEKWNNIKGINEKYHVLDEYISVFLTQSGSPCDKVCMKAARERHPALEEILRARQTEIESLQRSLHGAQIVDDSQSIAVVGRAFAAAYGAYKREAAVLDYDDLIEHAHHLLTSDGGTSWVMFKLDQSIRHVLVDEAQDTSAEQWQLIRALCREFFAGSGTHGEAPRTLFAVGDRKQSIFSFQGADPEEFSKMREWLETKVRQSAQPWKTLSMNHSFRCGPALLEAVDGVFSAHAQALTGHEASVIGHRSRHQDRPGRIILGEPVERTRIEHDPWRFPDRHEAGDQAPTRLAHQLAETIDGWIAHRSIRTEDPSPRPIQPRDIMILVRRRSQIMAAMVQALKKKGIEVTHNQAVEFRRHLAVRDCLACARFVLDPGDDFPLACLLKSPLIGLDEETLFDLCHGRGRSSLWERLQRRGQNRQIGEAVAFCRRLQGRSALPPYEFFDRLLTEPRGDSGMQRIVERMGNECRDIIEDFLDAACAFEDDHIPSLEGFCHWVERRGKEKRPDSEPSHNAVQVLTVHGAKGLEAPIVILADACRPLQPSEGGKGEGILSVQGRDGTSLLWAHSTKVLTGGAPTLAQEKKRREMWEYDRLFYVAMTRARSCLYVTGWKSGKGAGEVPPNSWYARIEAYCRSRPRSEATIFNTVEAPTPPPRPPPPAWMRRAAPPSVEATPPFHPSSLASPESGAGDSSRVYGRWVHHALNRLIGVEEGRRSELATLLATQMRHLAGADPASDGIIGQAIEEARRTLDHPAWRDWQPGIVLPEVGLSGALPFPRVLRGRIDCLIVQEKRVVLIEYKTAREPVSRHSYDAAAAQIACCHTLIRRIYPEKSLCPVLIWTSQPHIDMLTPRQVENGLALAQRHSLANRPRP